MGVAVRVPVAVGVDEANLRTTGREVELGVALGVVSKHAVFVKPASVFELLRSNAIDGEETAESSEPANTEIVKKNTTPSASTVQRRFILSVAIIAHTNLESR